MLFTNEIEVALPPQEVFAALTDMERIAPCLPGAEIEGKKDDEYLGRMSLRLGPVNVTYQGRLRFVEIDELQRRAVISARAEELNGFGGAEARITTSVAEVGDGSRIGVETDLQVRGRVAQFGRGAIAPTANRMLTDFAANLETLLSSGPPSSEDASFAEPTRRGSPQPAPGTPLDLGSLIDVRRLVTPAVCVFLGFGYGYLLGRLRERGRLSAR